MERSYARYPEGEREKKTAAPPICDIMADTLSVLYGTTENRNDREGYGRRGAAQHRDLTQFNSRQYARHSTLNHGIGTNST